jgi:hypothetical protein
VTIGASSFLVPTPTGWSGSGLADTVKVVRVNQRVGKSLSRNLRRGQVRKRIQHPALGASLV